MGRPEAFDLVFTDGTRHSCIVQRRKGTELGVKFVPTGTVMT